MEQAQAALQSCFGYREFRPQQAEIISAVLGGRDVIVLMPTGGGKSICFQIPAIVMPGTCIVVSPLIALMKDQVEGLKASGVRAAYINSSSSGPENQEVERAALRGELDLLYVSPEKLLSPDFFNLLKNLHVCMFAIDEAHCISQWGHDFRPEYVQMGVLKDRFPSTPVMALTATADKLTRKDIEQHLHLQNAAIFVASFDRPNLSLAVVSGQDRTADLMRWVKERPGQSGIVYCLSRQTCEILAAKLKDKGFAADFYHAGMGADQRSRVQEAFIRDDIDVICATVAFGMGIDKSNVRWVIHFNLPKNVESYYQEIGRAGRDELPSETQLFYSYTDVVQLQKFIEESGQKDILETKLQRIIQYATATSCRRQILLNYFGEPNGGECGNCDNCRAPKRDLDATVIVQKALSAIIRTHEEIGVNMTVDILRGSQNQELRNRGFHLLRTYGAGADISRRDWVDYLVQMINRGLLEIAYDQGNSLKVTAAGREVLFNGRKVALSHPRVFEKSKRDKKPAATPKPVATLTDALFERLKLLRKEIADAQGVPPYVIFHDRTLRLMAEERPTSEPEMRKISGVGDRKYQLYGSDFIDVILRFIQEQRVKS
ncbi:MAG: hypothetical protein RLZZ165_1876 [Bacteroidota bacterium]